MNIRLFTKTNIFYLNVCAGAVFILSALFLARDVVSLHFDRSRAAKTQSVPSAGAVGGVSSVQFDEYAGILRDNPFGFASGELRPLTRSSGNKEGRAADVALVGTVVGPPDLSFGVFKDGSGVQQVFKLGESVFGVGKLHRVGKDKVLVRQGGQTTEILLDDVRIKEIKKPAAGGGAPAAALAQRVGRGMYVVDQMKLQQAIANPGQMMTDARLRPNIADGREEGFVLSEVRPGGIYHSLGLQDGDVLLRINEYDISNPERALQAFTALKGLDRVQVDMIRSGAKMTMTYQIK
ncbi:MAG: type II secretion system protein GspC [Nitrospirota bacterium]